jgi:ABC-type transporter Mla MlaB component
VAAPGLPRTTRVLALRPLTEPNGIVLVISGPLARADIEGLCECVRALLEGSEADLVVCDVGELVDPDAVTVDALARLQLTAQRLGRRVRFRNACNELQDLLALLGLTEVVSCGPGLPPESWGETEERKEGLGVEEESDPGDPPA